MYQIKRNENESAVETAFEGGEKTGFLVFLVITLVSLGLVALKKYFPGVELGPISLGLVFAATGCVTFQFCSGIFKAFEGLCALLELKPKYSFASALLLLAIRRLVLIAGANYEAAKELLENLDFCLLVATLIITATPLTIHLVKFCMKKLAEAANVIGDWLDEVF